VNKANKAIIILFLVLMLAYSCFAYSTYGAPTRFGNATTTTCQVGGDPGIVNCTGDAYFNTYYGNGSNLNTNSSTWWASVSGWVSGWFVKSGNSLNLNESKLNATIDSRTSSYANKAGTGTCPSGYAVQNTTTGGVQCVILTAGAQGPQGIPGINGTNGLNGSQGPQGVPGINGTNGANGLSSNITVINNGDGTYLWKFYYTNGTNYANFTTSNLTGLQGIQGIQGIAGTNGTNGVNGSQGPQGIPGVNGTNGVDGINGTNGANGTFTDILNSTQFYNSSNTWSINTSIMQRRVGASCMYGIGLINQDGSIACSAQQGTLSNGSDANLSSLIVSDNVTADWFHGKLNYSDLQNVPTIATINVSMFVGKTVTTYNGNIGSYDIANSACNTAISGAHMCTVEELLNTMIYSNVSSIAAWTGTVWIQGGPPGYTANANDCLGFTSSGSSNLGRFWDFDDTTANGMAWLTNCANSKSLACCKQ
jgi:hypothetical protein